MDVKIELEDSKNPDGEHHIMILEVPDNCTTDAMIELYIRNNTGGALIRWKRLHE